MEEDEKMQQSSVGNYHSWEATILNKKDLNKSLKRIKR